MSDSVNLDSLCTCGSSKPIKYCCFKTMNTEPPGPKTNYSHPKCFAKELCDCSKQITKEHFFTKSVMELLGKEGKVKAPFLNEEKPLKFSALSAKILCQRHNNALSELDALAKKFFEFGLLKTSSEYLIVRGTDIERWLLKVLCGYLFTGYAQTVNGDLIAAKPPPLAVLRVLFGYQELPSNWGLAIPEKKGMFLSEGMNVSTLADINHIVIGCEYRISYIRLMLFLIDIQGMQESLDKITYRPSCFAFEVDGQYREIHFGWETGKFVKLTFSKTKR